MTETNNEGLVKIRRALISVSDKTGIVDFARELQRFGVEIISTGGTAKTLRDAGLEVRDVSEVTGFPEMMDGRIKTLHPKIHGALLSVRDNPEHQAAMREHNIEQIDIGGPAMIRSAAKNWKDVAVMVSSEDYQPITDEMKMHDGSLSRTTRLKLARQAFSRTATYDMMISGHFTSSLLDIGGSKRGWRGIGSGGGGGGSNFTFTEIAKRLSQQMSDLIDRGVLM